MTLGVMYWPRKQGVKPMTGPYTCRAPLIKSWAFKKTFVALKVIVKGCSVKFLPFHRQLRPVEVVLAIFGPNFRLFDIKDGGDWSEEFEL